MFGILPAGHPMLGGFIFHNFDAEPTFPLRKQIRNEIRSLSLKESAGEKSGAVVNGEGIFEMPLGPVYSGVAEAAHFDLSSIGEEILWVKPRFFYKHRGLEKTAEDLRPEQALLLAERIAGTTSVSESLAFCQAVEELAGIEVPPRALYIRTILAELERIYHHVGNIAEICESTALGVGTAQGFILKERLLRLNALLTGHRYLMGTNCIGGVRIDLSKQRFRTLRKTLLEFHVEYRKWIHMLLSTDSFLDRLEGIGVLSPDAASDLGAIGPVGRASNMDRDFRRDHPYAAYNAVKFKVPTAADGDCLARMRMRHEEVEQSLSIIHQLSYLLPRGTCSNHAPVQVAHGAEAYGFCEGPRGNTMQWLKMGENGLIWRWRVRTPSLVNWHTYSMATEGSSFQDFPIILASFGLSHAECDR
jgi:Ni,Fe-hydrogenase III large subunit